MTADVAIQISQLSHTYPKTKKAAARRALNEVSLQVGRGEMVAVLGPNGSGKSTLLRVLTTALKPASGSVEVAGFDVARQAAQVRQTLGVVFQKPALDIKMTVEENLRAMGLLYGVSGSQLKERITRMLDELGLQERRKDRVETLSGGLARKVELAKALLPEPRILIMDEPTSGLDPVARHEFWALVGGLRSKGELTVVVTTHLLDEAERCDRVAILHQGQLLACDRPAQLQSSIGQEILSIDAEELEQLQGQLAADYDFESRIVDGSLRVTLSAEVSLDDLRSQFKGRFKSLTVAPPSLDDVFVHFTGEHLGASQEGTS